MHPFLVLTEKYYVQVTPAFATHLFKNFIATGNKYRKLSELKFSFYC